MADVNIVYFELKNILFKAGIDNAGFEVEQLLIKVAGNSHTLLNTISDEEYKQLNAMVCRRINNEPLQYILQEWDFLGLTLFVGAGVLIPRPETEEVCLKAVSLLPANAQVNVLDLCAGSGAIALGLQKQLPKANVAAVELDNAAFAFLQKNTAKYNGEFAKVPAAVLADALSYYKQLQEESVDLIVSNPPYVTHGEYASLQAEVLFEPKVALVAEDNGLLFYKAISEKYYSALKKGGYLVFEIGFGQGEELQAILKSFGYCDIEILKDLQGNNRIAVGRKLC